MADPLFSLAYFSRNAIEGTPEQVYADVEEILVSARRKNGLQGVTGALIFSNGCFAQVLEGARDKVESVFETIQCDPRHRDVTILHLHAVEERSFGDWSMAFGGIEGVSVDPKVRADGMGPVDGILATSAGQTLLSALRNVVHRDDLALRDELAAG
ncbi:MAG: BLUF domain-containing protein [Rhizobiales bacterium]|nr:BLUF domain-containing protein [Rhizobacter sp.]